MEPNKKEYVLIFITVTYSFDQSCMHIWFDPIEIVAFAANCTLGNILAA